MSTIITVRVPRELKEKLKKHNIDISNVVRELLTKYVEELETRELLEELDRIRSELGDKVDPNRVAELVREDRDR